MEELPTTVPSLGRAAAPGCLAEYTKRAASGILDALDIAALKPYIRLDPSEKRSGDGRTPTDADLDACHGRQELVRIDGRAYSYVYRLTREYPYTLGCFTSQLLASTLRDVRDGLAPRARRRRR